MERWGAVCKHGRWGIGANGGAAVGNSWLYLLRSLFLLHEPYIVEILNLLVSCKCGKYELFSCICGKYELFSYICGKYELFSRKCGKYELLSRFCGKKVKLVERGKQVQLWSRFSRKKVAIFVEMEIKALSVSFPGKKKNAKIVHVLQIVHYATNAQGMIHVSVGSFGIKKIRQKEGNIRFIGIIEIYGFTRETHQLL